MVCQPLHALDSACLIYSLHRIKRVHLHVSRVHPHVSRVYLCVSKVQVFRAYLQVTRVHPRVSKVHPGYPVSIFRQLESISRYLESISRYLDFIYRYKLFECISRYPEPIGISKYIQSLSLGWHHPFPEQKTIDECLETQKISSKSHNPAKNLQGQFYDIIIVQHLDN